MNSSKTLSRFVVDNDQLPLLYPLFQKGFKVRGPVGCTLKSLFHDIWRLTPEYVQQRIGTVFLNAKPVDDLETAVIGDGSRLALSSAMPGLVGAVMRRASPFAVMRESISCGDSDQSPMPGTGQGTFTVKLFNLLMEEIGPEFVRRGIWIDNADLKPVFKDRERELAGLPSPVLVVLDTGDSEQDCV